MKRQPLPVVTNCNDCGACRREQAALPVSLVGEHVRMKSVTPLPEDLKAELLAAVERFQRDGWPADGTPCIWYDPETKRCRHYEHRPTLCRDAIQPGDRTCLRWRREYGIDPRMVYHMRRGRLISVIVKHKRQANPA
jgi:Fe-S-cluster containining protein